MAKGGVHGHIMAAFMSGVPMMVCGVPMHVRWLLDTVKLTADSVPVSSFPIQLYVPGENRPYQRLLRHIVLITTSVLDYKV